MHVKGAALSLIAHAKPHRTFFAAQTSGLDRARTFAGDAVAIVTTGWPGVTTAVPHTGAPGVICQRGKGPVGRVLGHQEISRAQAALQNKRGP
jgi:hypothetical protein